MLTWKHDFSINCNYLETSVGYRKTDWSCWLIFLNFSLNIPYQEDQELFRRNRIKKRKVNMLAKEIWWANLTSFMPNRNPMRYSVGSSYILWKLERYFSYRKPKKNTLDRNKVSGTIWFVEQSHNFKWKGLKTFLES